MHLRWFAAEKCALHLKTNSPFGVAGLDSKIRRTIHVAASVASIGKLDSNDKSAPGWSSPETFPMTKCDFVFLHYWLVGWRSRRRNDAESLEQYGTICACIVEESLSNHAPHPKDTALSTSPRKPQTTRIKKPTGWATPTCMANRNRIVPDNPVQEIIL